MNPAAASEASAPPYEAEDDLVRGDAGWQREDEMPPGAAAAAGRQDMPPGRDARRRQDMPPTGAARQRTDDVARRPPPLAAARGAHGAAQTAGAPREDVVGEDTKDLDVDLDLLTAEEEAVPAPKRPSLSPPARSHPPPPPPAALHTSRPPPRK
jgi:hypothetical protein